MSQQTTLSGEIAYDISADTSKAKNEFQDLTSILQRTLSAAYGVVGILRALGLGEDVDVAMQEMMRMIMMINMLITALNALRMAMLPGASMIAKVASIVGLAGTGISMAGFVGTFAEASMHGSLYNATMGRQR